MDAPGNNKGALCSCVNLIDPRTQVCVSRRRRCSSPPRRWPAPELHWLAGVGQQKNTHPGCHKRLPYHPPISDASRRGVFQTITRYGSAMYISGIFCRAVLTLSQDACSRRASGVVRAPVAVRSVDGACGSTSRWWRYVPSWLILAKRLS